MWHATFTKKSLEGSSTFTSREAGVGTSLTIGVGMGQGHRRNPASYRVLFRDFLVFAATTSLRQWTLSML